MTRFDGECWLCDVQETIVCEGLSAVGAGVSAISSIMGGFSQASAQRQAAAAQNTEDQYVAQQYNQQAGQARASDQRSYMDQQQRTTLLQEKAQAASAGSGATSTDPSVVNIEGDIGERGHYDALSAMYTGEEKALGLETGANLKQYEGSQSVIAGNELADASIIKGIGSGIGAIASSKGIQQMFAPPAGGTIAGSPNAESLFSKYASGYN